MKSKFFALPVLVLLLCMASSVKADSPLTSTYFAASYYEFGIVAEAETAHTLTANVMDYLLDPDNPVDVKAAVINAVGWTYESTSNGAIFWDKLAEKKGKTTTSLTLNDLSGHELMCYGYLLAMSDYFDVSRAIPALELAAQKNPESYTVHMILALVRAQKDMDSDWCAVWKHTRSVLNDVTLKRDMKTSAIQTIVDYMILYKSSCVE